MELACDIAEHTKFIPKHRHIVMAYIVMAHVVMAHVVMACIVIAYQVMAYVYLWPYILMALYTYGPI